MVALMKENPVVERTTYFYCYNPKVRKFLGLAGLRWEWKGVHDNTKRTYWTFERSEELDRLITRYQNEK